MRLLLFDDRRSDGWHPFSLSRPVSELRFGCLLQRRRLERWAGVETAAVFARPWLTSFREQGAPPVLDRSRPDAGHGDGEATLWLSSRWVPEPETSSELPNESAVLRSGEVVVGCFLPGNVPGPDPAWLADPEGDRSDAVTLEVGGSVLGEAWELVAGSADQVTRDVRALAPAATLRAAADLPTGVHLLGDGAVHLAEGATLEPGVLLDTRGGPIWLEREVEARAPVRLAGPRWAGPGSRLLGGDISRLAAGPVSYLRGEVADLTTLGWINKAHDGYVGHSYLGRWVNLGAGTVTSDLKNNYGSVRVGGPDGARETGLLKMGAFLGDHARTAIGTLLTTGAAVGVGANLFGEPRTPRWVPPFQWGLGPEAPRYRLPDFLDTASTAMARRDVTLGERGRSWLTAVWEEARRRDGASA